MVRTSTSWTAAARSDLLSLQIKNGLRAVFCCVLGFVDVFRLVRAGSRPASYSLRSPNRLVRLPALTRLQLLQTQHHWSYFIGAAPGWGLSGSADLASAASMRPTAQATTRRGKPPQMPKIKSPPAPAPTESQTARTRWSESLWPASSPRPPCRGARLCPG